MISVILFMTVLLTLGFVAGWIFGGSRDGTHWRRKAERLAQSYESLKRYVADRDEQWRREFLASHAYDQHWRKGLHKMAMEQRNPTDTRTLSQVLQLWDPADRQLLQSALDIARAEK